MIVVAIIGILAAVVIPNWASTSRNKKYDPEITAMTTEIANREEMYKTEVGNGSYLAAAACPASPSQAGVDFNSSCVGSGSNAWGSLRVVATDSVIRCSYSVVIGAAGTQPSSAPAACKQPAAGGPALAGSWYYTLAVCDMDGNGGTNANFCMSSWNPQVNSVNYGQ